MVWCVASIQPVLTASISVLRLQELEDQYRKEREEVNNLLEQQRLVGKLAHFVVLQEFVQRTF